MQKKAAIYHFTDQSQKRPIVYKKTVSDLIEYAHALGYSHPDIYCDTDLARGRQPEYDKLLSKADQYSVLIVKDLKHVSRTTVKAVKTIRQLEEKNIAVLTLDDGDFYPAEPPFGKELRVASYVHKPLDLLERDEAIATQQAVMRLFIKKKTNWSLKAEYHDTTLHQNKGTQTDLLSLISHRSDYDIVIVGSLGEIHWRSEEYAHMWNALKLPIYSLKYGYFPYRKESHDLRFTD